MKKERGNWLWDWMASFYDQFYQRFPPYQRLHQEIFQALRDFSPHQGNILDAGCGTGLLAASLARFKYQVVGLDQSPAMLGQAWRKKTRENLKNLQFLEGDLNEPRILAGQCFHRVLFIHSLYLADDPGETLKNLSSVMPPGGEVILCNPSRRLSLSELWMGGRSFLTEVSRQQGLAAMIPLAAVALAMGVLNVVIQRRKKKTYRCWSEEEMKDFLRRCRFKLKWMKKSCLGDSHLLLCAVKET